MHRDGDGVREEWVDGSARPVSWPDGTGDAARCEGLCHAVSRDMERPYRWRRGREAVGPAHVPCANGNLRFVEGVLACTGGRYGTGYDFGLVVLAASRRSVADGDACVRDLLGTPNVWNVVVADFAARSCLVFHRGRDGGWRRDACVGGDWVVRLDGIGAVLMAEMVPATEADVGLPGRGRLIDRGRPGISRPWPLA